MGAPEPAGGTVCSRTENACRLNDIPNVGNEAVGRSLLNPAFLRRIPCPPRTAGKSIVGRVAQKAVGRNDAMTHIVGRPDKSHFGVPPFRQSIPSPALD